MAAIAELLIVSTSTVAAYAFATWYFEEGLFPERDIRASPAAYGGHRHAFSLLAAGRVFAATFSLAVWILELIVFEVAGVLRPATRAVCWRVSLSLMALNLHAVLPFLVAFAALSHRFGAGRLAAVGAAAAVLLFAGLSWWLEEGLQGGGAGNGFGNGPGNGSGDGNGLGNGLGNGSGSGLGNGLGSGEPSRLLAEIEQHFFSLEAALARIGVVGVASLAVLSGFGAVSFPLQQLSTLLARATPAGLASREAQLRRTLSLAGRRRAAALDPRLAGWESRGRSGAGGSGGSGGEGREKASSQWLSFSGWLEGGSKGDAGAAAVSGLEQLAQDLFGEVLQMRAALAGQREARTPRGRALLVLGLFMLAYCFFKMASAARNVLIGPSRSDTDPVTAWMAYLLARWGLLGQVDFRAWTAAASFVLIGVLVVLQVRGFLLTIMKVSRSRSVSGTAIPAQVLSLLLAHLMGTYLASSVLLLRTNLPRRHRLAITHALGDIRFSFFTRWFDIIFLVSGCVSAVFLLATGQARLRLVKQEADGAAPEGSDHRAD